MNSMEISFMALLENVGFARSVVGAFLAPLNPTIDEVVEWKTIVSEGVSNAIIHGYNFDVERKVRMSVHIHERTVTLIIEDDGLGIEDIHQVRVPFYTSRADVEHAGMGLTIIDTLCDSFVIESELNKGTKLIIVKELKNHGNV